MLYQPFIPGISPTWSWLMIFMMHFCIHFANILLRILASVSIGILVYNFLFLYYLCLSGFGNKATLVCKVSLGVYRSLELFSNSLRRGVLPGVFCKNSSLYPSCSGLSFWGDYFITASN